MAITWQGPWDISRIFTDADRKAIHAQVMAKHSMAFNAQDDKQVILIDSEDAANELRLHHSPLIYQHMQVLYAPALLAAWQRPAPFVAPTVYPMVVCQDVMGTIWTNTFHFRDTTDWQNQVDKGLHEFRRGLLERGIVHPVQDSEISFVQRPAGEGQARITMRWSPGDPMGTALYATRSDGTADVMVGTLNTNAMLANPFACDVWGWNWLVGGWAATPPSEAQSFPGDRLQGARRPHLDLGRRFVSAGTHMSGGSFDLDPSAFKDALLHFRASTLSTSDTFKNFGFDKD